ncbi:MAG: polysaccharide deacetylase family protein [Acidobacteriota bacterium]|nr:polysaccharide deacetylase family protein [Acidobacteriota bacterium]
MYHRVSTSGSAGAGWGNRSLSVDIADFDRQIRVLSERQNCLSVPEVIDRMVEGQLPGKALTITFDDGYRDNLDHALPVLERWSVPATIYVCTGLVDAARPPWWVELEALVASLDEIAVDLGSERLVRTLSSDWDRFVAFQKIADQGRRGDPATFQRIMAQVRDQAPEIAEMTNPMLSWEEVRRLDAHPLITIGAHTVTHPPLARLSDSEVIGELEEGKKRLEHELGHPVVHLAYPFGEVEQVGVREVRLAEAVGFRSAFTTRAGHLCRSHAGHLRALPRLMVAHDDSMLDLEWKCSGLQHLIGRRGRRLVTL